MIVLLKFLFSFFLSHFVETSFFENCSHSSIEFLIVALEVFEDGLWPQKVSEDSLWTPSFWALNCYTCVITDLVSNLNVFGSFWDVKRMLNLVNFSLDFVKIFIVAALLDVLKNLGSKLLLYLGFCSISIFQSIM